MKSLKKVSAAILSSAVMLCMVPAIPSAESSYREVLVTNTDELLTALSDARAGDEIILREGIYQNDESFGEWAAFYSYADGTIEQPITIRSEDPDNPATISGVTQENKMALYITGDYWRIKDLKISNAAKGIMLDNSNYSVISGCEVFNIGTEGIHLRDNSSYCIVEECYVHDTGTVTPGYGEAVYIGSANSTQGYGYDCHYNTIRGCKLGPNVAAEHVDIKEYTLGAVVEDCIFDGTGITGANYAVSFVAIKGNNGVIRNNIGYRNGCSAVKYAFQASVQVDGWGQHNKIYDNTVYMDTTDCYLMKEWNCETLVFRNTVEPAGLTCSGNKTVQVRGFELDGDVNEDGSADAADIATIRDYILGGELSHISVKNSDLCNDGNLDSFDLAAVRKIIGSGADASAKMLVEFNEESEGKWRMCNGLGGRTVTFTLQGEPDSYMNLGGGYWDPNYTDTDGSSGAWIPLSHGTIQADENGIISVVVVLPEAVTSVAIQIYDYYNDASDLDVSTAELISAVTQ